MLFVIPTGLVLIAIIDLPPLARKKQWKDMWVIVVILLFVGVLGTLQVLEKAPPSPLMAVTELFKKWGIMYPTFD